MQGTQIDNSPIENFFTSRIVSISTLIEEIRLVALVKYEFEYREKLKMNCFFLDVLDYQGTDAREKKIEFSVEYSSNNVVSVIEILSEEIELVVSQN